MLEEAGEHETGIFVILYTEDALFS